MPRSSRQPALDGDRHLHPLRCHIEPETLTMRNPPTKDDPIKYNDAGEVVAYHLSLEARVHHILLSGNDDGRCNRLIRLCMDLASVWPTTATRIDHLHNHKGTLYYRTCGDVEHGHHPHRVLSILWEKYDGCDNVENMDECEGGFVFREFARFPIVDPVLNCETPV
jgi:hypothetical protein